MMVWDKAYTRAMRDIFRKHGADLDVRCLFVDAIMNETPWQMWNLETGKPTEGAETLEAMAVLDEAFETDAASWNHPGLLHLYVHLIEMSPFPQRALRAGDRLRELVPDSGHLVHMPTHIDVLCGNYNDVMRWNQKAVAADRKFVEREGVMNFYTLYRVHNHHFVIYGAMFLGQYTPAIEAAQELIDTMPEALLRIPSPPMADFLEPFLSMKQHVLIRFGKWREIIAQELPEDRDLYCSTVAMMLYAKGVAHSVLGEIAEAEKAREAFRAAKARVPDTRLVHNNTVEDLLDVAAEMLSGELEYRRGNVDIGLRPSAPRRRALRCAALRRAVGLDAAAAPCAGRAPAGAGAARGGRGGLSLGPRLRRQARPRLPASRQRVEPARPARMPDAARRHRRGAADQGPARARPGPHRGPDPRLLPLPARGGLRSRL